MSLSQTPLWKTPRVQILAGAIGCGVITVVIFVCGLLGFLLIGTHSAKVMQGRSGRLEVEVPADKTWYNTGIEIPAGREVHIENDILKSRPGLQYVVSIEDKEYVSEGNRSEVTVRVNKTSDLSIRSTVSSSNLKLQLNVEIND